jgi:hypothetical protein
MDMLWYSPTRISTQLEKGNLVLLREPSVIDSPTSFFSVEYKVVVVNFEVV